MKIEKVSVTYGELRSGPGFTNTKHEIMLQAQLEPGENASTTKQRLHELAKMEVKKLFGDDTSQTELDIPF